MFEGDYTINGTHATYIKYLVNDVKAFDRYIDVYMAGAALGVLNDKRAKQGVITDNLIDAFIKVAQVQAAGGIIVTVDDGRLAMQLRGF